MWSSLHFLNIAQRERCLRERESTMTVPNDNEDHSTGQQFPEKQTNGTSSPKETNSAKSGGKLPGISTMVKKYDSQDTKQNEEMIGANGLHSEYGPDSEINKKLKNKAHGQRTELIGNTDANNLENWRIKHPENWNNEVVMNWIYSIAEESPEIDVETLCGEAFINITGKDLIRMSEKDFIELDSAHGSFLYDMFRGINGDVDFIPPDECEGISVSIPFFRDLILGGGDQSEFQLDDVTLNGEEHEEFSDSCDDASPLKRPRLPSAEIQGKLYPFDPNLPFDLPDETSVRLDKESDDATRGTSSMRSLGSGSTKFNGNQLGSISSEVSDVTSLISATTDESVLGVYGASQYEPGIQEVPNLGQFEPTQEEQCDFNYDLMHQSMQPQPVIHQQTDHPTVTYLRERGCHQNPETGLFYYEDTGSRIPKYPGLCDANNNNNNVTIPCQTSHYAHNQQGMGQSEQPQYPSQKPGKVTKRQKRPAQGGPPKSTAPKSTPRVKQPRKSAKKPVDPDRPKSKRGRKKGQLSKDNHLWRFLLQLLKDDEFNPEHIRWENQTQGIFTIVNSAFVAELWGKKKKNDKMNYEKMSRAIRFCKTPGYIKDAPKDGSYPKKLCYAFGPNAAWQDDASSEQGN